MEIAGKIFDKESPELLAETAANTVGINNLHKVDKAGSVEMQAIEFLKAGWERAHVPDFSRARRPRSATPNPRSLNCMPPSISDILNLGQNTRHPRNSVAPECSNVHIKRLPRAVCVQKWFLPIIWGAERCRHAEMQS